MFDSQRKQGNTVLSVKASKSKTKKKPEKKDRSEAQVDEPQLLSKKVDTGETGHSEKVVQRQ